MNNIDGNKNTFSGGLHATGNVDGVPEKTISGHFGAYHAGHTVATVDPHTDLDRGAGSMWDLICGQSCNQVQGHGGNFRGVFVAIPYGQSGHHHVCISDPKEHNDHLYR